MEKVTIKEKLNAIVCLEIDELKAVLDKWFNEGDDRTSLSFGNDPDNLPVFNRYYDDITRTYYVKRIEVCNEGYYLVLNSINCDRCEENNDYQYLDQDRDNFIPGELDKLTEFVRKAISKCNSLYELSAEQKLAITMFKAAVKELEKQKVELLFDNDYGNVYFYNGTDIEDIDENSDEYSIEIKLEKLPNTELPAYKFYETSDVLFATPKSNG